MSSVNVTSYLSNETLWYASRATGVVSVVLLTAVMVLGMVISAHRNPHSPTPTVIMAVHRWLSLGMVAFLAVHIATAIAETYVKIDLIAAFIPMTSQYEPVLIALGALAVDLLLAVLITSWLRHRLPERTWKAIHLLAYLLLPSAIAHAYLLGTADEPLLRWTSLGCAVVAVLALGWRVATNSHDRQRRREISTSGKEWA